MTEFGSFPDTKSVRFVCLLPAPIERVWDHLTRPDALAKWLARGRIEPRLGGSVALTFPTEKGGAKIRGVVRRFVPPQVLAYTWQLEMPNGETLESVVTFEMEPEGERVRLVLTHQLIAPGFQPHTGAGWHALLDGLEARLEGIAPEPFMEIVARVFAFYANAAGPAIQ